MSTIEFETVHYAQSFVIQERHSPLFKYPELQFVQILFILII